MPGNSNGRNIHKAISKLVNVREKKTRLEMVTCFIVLIVLIKKRKKEMCRQNA